MTPILHAIAAAADATSRYRTQVMIKSLVLGFSIGTVFFGIAPLGSGHKSEKNSLLLNESNVCFSPDHAL
jgi:hypothetical protein